MNSLAKIPRILPFFPECSESCEVHSVRNELFQFFHWSYKSNVGNKQEKLIAASLHQIIAPVQLLCNPK